MLYWLTGLSFLTFLIIPNSLNSLSYQKLMYFKIDLWIRNIKRIITCYCFTSILNRVSKAKIKFNSDSWLIMTQLPSFAWYDCKTASKPTAGLFENSLCLVNEDKQLYSVHHLISALEKIDNPFPYYMVILWRHWPPTIRVYHPVTYPRGLYFSGIYLLCYNFLYYTNLNSVNLIVNTVARCMWMLYRLCSAHTVMY